MGCDKAFLEIDGVPLWQRQIRLLEELAPNEILIAGPSHPEWIATGYSILPDAGENAGPLAGLVAALRRSSTPFLLALAVDLPNMTTHYLRQLVGACGNGRGVVPKRADRFEPLAAIYPIISRAIAEGFLQTERSSLQTFVRQCISDDFILEKPVIAHEERLFLNLNTPTDFATLRNGP